MSRFVVDASVAVMWFIPEQFSRQAAGLLRADHQLIAPEFMAYEVAHVLLKRVRRRELDVADARPYVDATRELATLYPLSYALSALFDVAMIFGTSLYDAIYLSLGHQQDAPVITADGGLYRAASARDADSVVWIEEFTAS